MRARVIEGLRRRYNFIMHCERTERWKMLKKSQEIWDILPSKNCFQNKSEENRQEFILTTIREGNYTKLNKQRFSK